MGRWPVRAVVVLATCGAVAACGGKPVRLARFSDSQTGVSFSYPAAWRVQYADSGLSLEESIVVTLSTFHLQSPCRRLSASSGECGVALMAKHLPPGGVFVVWTDGGPVQGPNYPEGMPGASTTVGGRPAKLSTKRSQGGCDLPEASQTITAYVTGPVTMTACGRDGKNFKAEVVALLKSVEFTTPRPTRLGA